MKFKIVNNCNNNLAYNELRDALNNCFENVEYVEQNEDMLITLTSKGLTNAWKSIDAQKYIIDSTGNSITITGNSDIAVFYGVCDLVENFDVKHLLTYDVYPENKSKVFSHSIYNNQEFKPKQRIREWRVLADFLSGGEGRTLKEQLNLIKQLARLKNNSIKLDVWLFPPFLSYSCINPETKEVIKKEGGTLHCNQQFEVKPNSISEKFTEQTSRYTNPDFKNCQNDEELSITAQRYINEIIIEAKKFDMRVSLQFNPFDYPGNFAAMLEKPMPVQQIGGVQVCEGGDVTGEKSLFMIKLLFDTVINNYPDTDCFTVVMPEIARKADGFEEAVKYLDQKFNISSKFNLDEMLSYRDEMLVTPGGVERAYNEGRMNLQLIAALYKLFDISGLADKLFKMGKTIGFSCGAVTPYLTPLYASLLAEGFELYVGCYTCDHLYKTLSSYENYDFENLKIIQVLTLEDDNVGGIYQSQIPSLSAILDFDINHHIDAFSTRFWPTGDLEEMSKAITDACWKDTTVSKALESNLNELYTPVKDIMNNVFKHLEDNSKILNITDLGIMFQINNHISEYVGSKSYNVSLGASFSIVTYFEIERLLNIALKNNELNSFQRSRIEYIKARINFSYGLLKQLYLICQANYIYHNKDQEEGIRKYIESVEFIKGILNNTSKYIKYDNDLAHLVIYEHLCVNEVLDKISDLKKK